MMRVGVDLGGTKVEGVVIDAADNVLWRERVLLDLPDADLVQQYEHTLQRIEHLLALMVQAQPETINMPVGIGTPGAETAQGVMKNCNSVCLNGQPLGKDLQQRLQRPVRLANDANCFTLAEARMGAAREARHVFGVILGTGVGGGLVIGEQLHVGVNGIAGEWGHNSLPATLLNADSMRGQKTNRPCYCGRVDCVETWLSGPGLSESYASLAGQTVPAEEVVKRAGAGEAQAVQVMELYYEQLAHCLAQVINVFDPEVVVLGGGLSKITALYEEVPRRWQSGIFSNTINTQLRQATLGDSAGVFGAAWLWE